MPSQITDVFYANFIQWVREKGNCYSTIKLYCNQLKSALNWASRHGCKLSQTYNIYDVPRYFKSRVAISQDAVIRAREASKCVFRARNRSSDARYFDSKNGKVARFSVAHNFGKGMPALFLDAVMFSKNGSKDITIPEEILKKGAPVLITGYFRPNINTKDGVKHESRDMVVTSCDPLAEEAEGAE